MTINILISILLLAIAILGYYEKKKWAIIVTIIAFIAQIIQIFISDMSDTTKKYILETDKNTVVNEVLKTQIQLKSLSEKLETEKNKIKN